MELGEPNRAAAASLVFYHLGDDAKTCGFQLLMGIEIRSFLGIDAFSAFSGTRFA